MSPPTGLADLSKCYVFKSRLNEYAQKAGLPAPLYETRMEGPVGRPVFQSKVTVDNVRYDSLPGFFNRKDAEQSAAEVALLELVKSGKLEKLIVHPPHETGLCKNLLQECAVKMGCETPTYICHADESAGVKHKFSCSVSVGDAHYVGAAASTKKEAEIKAARTALLAIQSSNNGAEAKPSNSPQLTVVPEQKEPESDTKKEVAMGSLKKRSGKKRKRHQGEVDQEAADMESSKDNQATSVEVTTNGHGNGDAGSQSNQLVSVTEANNNSENMKTTASTVNSSDHSFPIMGIISDRASNQVTPEAEGNDVAIVTEVAQVGAADVPVAKAGVEIIGSENSLGVVQVTQPVAKTGEKIVAAEVLNQNEEEQKPVEDGDVQRIAEQVQVPDSIDQPVDS